MKKVIVAMSGGVDSSVSAYLLKRKGYKIAGLFMKNWEEEDTKKYCSSLKDFLDAKSVCDQLNIELFTINFSMEYWDIVFKNLINEYQSGFTPNPDILCNKKIKFSLFLNFSIKKLKANYIATGHYVRLKKKNKEYQLLRAKDKKKDQSYFLYTLNQYQLSRSIFPIGNFKKSYVRHIAKENKFINSQKKDSVGICFIGKRKFRSFISKYINKQKPGFIINTDGLVLGKHKGLIYYTIGQRKGLGIGGVKKLNNEPWYVVDKNIKENSIIVAQGINNKKLKSSIFLVHKVHWINSIDFKNNIFCTVKIRYRQLDVPCCIEKINKKSVLVKLNYAVVIIAPGQSAVFYQGKVCLGGGIIKEKIK